MHEWPARLIAERIRDREITAHEVIEHHLARIESRSELNAFITVDTDGARRSAARIDESPSKGPLAGVPLAVKDAFDTEGIRTTYGSVIFAEHIPTQTAPAVQALLDAGAVLVGKANLDEFARGVMTHNPFFGACLNPRDPSRTPAGSSGGNAAALAAGLVALGLATDAGGSIRAPSAACGTAGFKPSFGSVSSEGSFGLAAPFDHVGPMARTIDDCVLAMTVLADMPEPPPVLDGLSVGLVGPIDDIARVESLAASVEMTTIPSFEHLIPLHLAEFARTHRRLFAEQGSLYSVPCARMLERGLAIGDGEQQRLREELAVWRERCRRELPFDVLVGPTLSREPPLLDDVETLELLLEVSWLTRPFNMLGWPAATCRDGVMFAGPSDALVLGAALAWEKGLPPPRTA